MKKEKSFQTINTVHKDQKYTDRNMSPNVFIKGKLWFKNVFAFMCQTNVFSFLIFDFALRRKQEKQLTPAEGAVSFTHLSFPAVRR